MKKHIPIIPIFLVSIWLTSCLDQKEIVVKSDPQLQLVDSLLSLQELQLHGQHLSKTGSINGVEEKLEIELDSSFVKSEFKILLDKKFNYIFTNGGYTKSEDENFITFRRKPEEYAGPLLLQLSFEGEGLSDLYLIEERDTYLYRTRNEAKFNFDTQTGLITKYQLQGLQKIIALDSTGYRISGKIKP